MKIQSQAISLFLVLSAASARAAAAGGETPQQLRGQQQERHLLFHTPECDDAGADKGRECYTLIKYKLEWPECVTDNLTVEQCKDLIRGQILAANHIAGDPSASIHLHLPDGLEESDIPENVDGPDFAGGPDFGAPPAEVVVDLVQNTNPSPTVVTLKKTFYNRYEVPVNYAGEVQGYLANGEIYYNIDGSKPWTYHCDPDWISMYPTSAGGGGKPEICEQETMEWSCRGAKDAGECEDRILRAMYEEDISIKDKAGNYMTPWVRQISPTPFHKSGEDGYFKDTEDHLAFCAWKYNADLDIYEGVEVSEEEQLKPLHESKKEAKNMKSVVTDALEKEELKKNDAFELVRKCHEHLRTLPDAGGICTELHYWTERYYPHDVPVVNNLEIKPFLEFLDKELDRFMRMPDRLEYKIEIHGTDAAGSGVAETPKLGHHYSNGTPVCVPGATV